MKFLLDTDILVSKKYLHYINEDFVVTTITLLELMSVLRRKYLEMLKNGERRRAEGYLNMLRVIVIHVKNRIIEATPEDFIQGIEIMIERDINAGDAVNAMIAKRTGRKVVSDDKDWDRVKDLVEVVRT